MQLQELIKVPYFSIKLGRRKEIIKEVPHAEGNWHHTVKSNLRKNKSAVEGNYVGEYNKVELHFFSFILLTD